MRKSAAKVVFCHGLETGPVGTKSIALRKAGFDLTTPDFRGMDLAQRVEKLESVLERLCNPIVVGSSCGGIAALCAASFCVMLFSQSAFFSAMFRLRTIFASKFMMLIGCYMHLTT